MNRADQANILLRQASELRERVRANLAAKTYREDDIQMNRYNQLISQAADLFPEDPLLNGELVKLPDAVLQGFQYPWGNPLNMPLDMPSRRLHERLTLLIDRLEMVLGGNLDTDRSAKSASEVLRAEHDFDTKKVLDALDELRRKQPELPPLDMRSFDFVSDVLLRQILALDYVEAQRDFAVDSFKSSAVASAGIIEGMLIDAMQKPAVVALAAYQSAVAKFPRAAGGQDVNWDRVSLMKLLGAARELNLLNEPSIRFGEGATDFRDTVHPLAELRIGARPGREEAEVLLALVRMVYRQLSMI